MYIHTYISYVEHILKRPLGPRATRNAAQVIAGTSQVQKQCREYNTGGLSKMLNNATSHDDP